MPPVFPRSQSPPPPTVWDRFAPAVRARRPPCHVPGAMRSGRERRLRPWGCAFQTSLASATSWAVASIAALRPEPTEGGGQGRGNSAQPSEPSVPGPGRSFPEGKLWGVHTTSRDRLLCPRTPGALTADRGQAHDIHLQFPSTRKENMGLAEVIMKHTELGMKTQMLEVNALDSHCNSGVNSQYRRGEQVCARTGLFGLRRRRRGLSGR